MNTNKLLQTIGYVWIIFLLAVTYLPMAAFAQADKKEFIFWNETTARIALPSSNERWIDINPESKIAAASFFKEYGKTIGLGPDDEMRLYNVINDKLGYTHYCYNQYYKNARVEGGSYNLHINNANVFYAANGNIVKNLEMNQMPQISREESFERAKNILNAKKYYWEEPALEEKLKQENKNPDTSYKPVGELMWAKLAGRESNTTQSAYQLCYRFTINCLSPLTSRNVFINAVDGTVLKNINLEVTCGGNHKTYRDTNSISKTTTVPLPALPNQLMAEEKSNKQLNEKDCTSGDNLQNNLSFVNRGSGGCEYFNVQTVYNGTRTVQIWSYDYPVFASNCNNIRTGNWNNDFDSDAPNPPPGQTTAGGSDVGLNSSEPDRKFAAQVHWGLDKAHYFFLDQFGRQGWNGSNGSINAFIYAYFEDESGIVYADNASFNPNTGMVKVGSGSFYIGVDDGYSPLDIIGHEFTHGVTQNNGSSGLTYQGESGALNESFSDIFGEAIENDATGTTHDFRHGWDRNDGAAIHFPNRDLSDPNSHSQPDTYGGTHWQTGSSDNGGVHTNSGVQNFMFYLLCQGGSGSNDNGTNYSVTGIGIVKAYKIAYRALTSGYYTSSSTYADSRRAWIHAAADLFGNCSNEVDQTKNAWTAVGVNAGAAQSGPSVGVCGTWPTAFSGNNLYGTIILAPLLSCNPYNTIISTSTPTSFAANEITLTAGFNAKAGCDFRAYIQSCPFPY